MEAYSIKAGVRGRPARKAGWRSWSALPGGVPPRPERERVFFIDNLLVRIHFIIVMMRWTDLAPWEFEFPFPGSLTSTFLSTGQVSWPNVRLASLPVLEIMQDAGLGC